MIEDIVNSSDLKKTLKKLFIEHNIEPLSFENGVYNHRHHVFIDSASDVDKSLHFSDIAIDTVKLMNVKISSISTTNID